MNLSKSFFNKKQFLNIQGELVDFSSPCVMGILNVTPDSFYSGNRFSGEKAIIERAGQIIDEGGRIIDVGAYSSRPNADNIDIHEETARLELALSLIRKEFPDVLISLDTFRSGIALRMVEKYGVSIINDISGGDADPEMFPTIARLKVPYILMHMRGTPQNMVGMASYKDVVKEVMYELAEKNRKLKELGVADVIIDAGFGFAKNMEQNYALLHHLELFQIFEQLLLVGISRKSMIYKLLGGGPEDALNGTVVLNTIAVQKGADILRVHDVKAASDVIRLMTHPHFTNNLI